MKLLVLGGTRFVGRAVVDDAVSRGWEVTVLNRSGTAHRPEVSALRGDRTVASGVDALKGGEWDVVVDTWSWAPVAVKISAHALVNRVGRYVYISSRSVYRDPVPDGADETHPVVVGDSSDTVFDDYARAKAGGEHAVRSVYADRALIVRPGLILGPHEDIGRLPWWLGVISGGGRVPAPGPHDLPLQYVDARDLSRWTLESAARGLGGDVDAVSRPGHATMGTLLEACVAATNSAVQLEWVEPQAIETAGLQPWTDLPIWIPPGPLHAMLHGSNVDKASAAGLECRPIESTVSDTWEWLRDSGGAAPQRTDRAQVGVGVDVLRGLLT